MVVCCKRFLWHFSMAYYYSSVFILVTSMQMRDNIVKNACNKEILRYNKLKRVLSTKLQWNMVNVKIFELNQFFILNVNDLSHFFPSYICESGKPEAVITSKIDIFQIYIFPFSDLECLLFTKLLTRYLSNISEIHRWIDESEECDEVVFIHQ